MKRERHDKHVEAMLENLVLYYKCLDYTNDKGMHPFHLPKNIAKKLVKYVDNFLAHYVVLAERSMQSVPPKCLWNMSTKHHYFWHIGMQAQDLNPRLSWCYSNEDFVGRISTIGMSCRYGQIAAHRSGSVMTRYTLGIVLRMFHAAS